MDFSNLKPGQLKTVTTLDKPLFVAAGAGSGKTFTLTQRVVWALTPGSGRDGKSYLDDLGQALIITFTNAAATEIKERVRGALRAQGLEEAALQVDSAWICTIHGMCSRILRDHALDLGIDPEFDLIPEVKADELLDTATEDAIREMRELPDMARLFELHGARGASFGRRADSAASAAGMARELARKALSSPSGFDSIEWVGSELNATAVAGDLMAAYETLMGTAQGAYPDDERRMADDIGRLDAWLREFPPSRRDATALSELMGQVDRPNGNHWGRAGQKEAYAEARLAHDNAVALAELTVERELREPLLKLATRIVGLYDRAKTQRGVLDNDDLMLKTFAAFEGHPDIAAEYSGRFRLVMVDEFQDTSEQQVKMVRMLSGPDACHLTTVGDAQQSIYRFRGADVSVFGRRGNALPDELKPTMADNFRSHDDVLRLVARVCGAPGMIPGFMDLAAAREETGDYPAAGEPRVFLEYTLSAKRGNRVCEAEDRSTMAAEQVADRLAWLAHERGVRPGDMALLMGRMKNTGHYVSALRERGVDCVVTGGSTFSGEPEVQVVAALLSSLANPHDTGRLFAALSSQLFSLDADDLVLLGSRRQDVADAPTKRPITRGMLDRQLYGDREPSVRLSQAFDVMGRAWDRMGSWQPADVVLAAARESGWLARLEAGGSEGQARAANVLAAIRHIRELCDDLSLGTARAAFEFEHWLAVAKAAPASLAGGEGDVVRVMTVHASKGLEFPVVAVAECLEDPKPKSSGCLAVVDGDRVLVSLSGGTKIPGHMEVPADAADCDTVVEWRAHLQQRDLREEADEKVRLLYVALTRAREALVLSVPVIVQKKGLKPQLAKDVTSALFEDGLPEPGLSPVDYGGSREALVRCVRMTPGDDARADPPYTVDCGGIADPRSSRPDRPAFSASGFSLYEQADPELPPIDPARARSGVYSYSAVRAAADGESAPADLPAVTCWSASVGDLSESGPAETLRGEGHADDPDDDKPAAVSLGSAFHELAQLMVETGSFPPASRVTAVATSWGCSRAQRERLDEALARWRDCPLRREALARDVVVAESPFFRHRPGRLGEYLTGAIDLLCYDNGSDTALVVDYKTGDAGRDAESLRRTHELQARMYADVLIDAGFRRVECAFACVERDDGDGGPVVVRYAFEKPADDAEPSVK